MPILLDISCLCDHHTDQALEIVHKAMSEPPDDGIWEQHPSPLVRKLVELFTQRGLRRIEAIEAQLRRWLAGESHQPGIELPTRPAGAMQRWTTAELAVAKTYLEALPPSAFTLDDWMLLADYLVQRYLPADDLRTEAEWLSTRAALMGRVQAVAGVLAEEGAEKLLQAMPTNSFWVDREFGMSPLQRAVVDYGSARCVENVVSLSDNLRHKLRRLILDHQEATFLGNKAAASEALATKLLDTFGTLNRDWRRIAVTEAGENLDQGFVASLPPGAKVRRVEKYRGACTFCRSIDGKVMEVVSADAPEKDGETQIWPGKTNVGRSASPRRRVGSALFDRAPHERWWIAAGVQHPHCRGSWVHLEEASKPVDPKFSSWMDEVLGRK